MEKRITDTQLKSRPKGTSQREVLASAFGMKKKDAGNLIKKTDKKYGSLKKRMSNVMEIAKKKK